MSRTSLRVTLIVFLTSAAVPASASEQTIQAEALLPRDSVAYFRFDGLGTHRDAYRETVVSELLEHEFGPLINDLSERILNALGPQLLGEKLLAGAQPEQLLKMQSAQKELPHLLEYLKQEGFVVGAEVISPRPPRFQITIVFPQGGKPQHRTALYGGMRLIGLLSETEVEEVPRDGRVFLKLNVEQEQVKVFCWQQGDHMLLTIGTEDVDHTLGLWLTANGRT